jgi:hypothetical protein
VAEVIDLRYLRAGDIVRVERAGTFHYGLVQTPRNRSARFPEREVIYLPCALPGVPYSVASQHMSCLRAEISGVWHADAQTARTHPSGTDAYEEWADMHNAVLNIERG